MQTVLVPVDGSPGSGRALPTAVWLARLTGTTLVLCTVTEAGTDPAAILQAAASGGDGIGDHVEVILTDVAPAPGIVDEGERRPECVVVMATRGEQSPDRSLLGSVAELVVAGTSRPVVLVGPACLASAEATAAPVLVADDGSEPARHAARRSAGLVAALGHPVVVAQVAAGDRVGLASSHTVDALSAEGISASQRVVTGDDPVAGLLSLAEEIGAALIVVGSHGSSGSGVRVLGTTAAGVVHAAHCPVVVVRPPMLFG